MQRVPLLALGLLLFLPTPWTRAGNPTMDIKTYLSQRDELKDRDLPALKTIAADSGEKATRRGIAEYYIFLKAVASGGDPASGAKALAALETATDAYMDPFSYVKLAQVYSQDRPTLGVRQDQAKALRNLSVAWEIADLSNKATGNNELLTMIINNSLGVGDGIFSGRTNDNAEMKQLLDPIRPSVWQARERFRKMYGLSVKGDTSGPTSVEYHYAR